MTLTHAQETRRRARTAPMAARIGQCPGKLPDPGGQHPGARAAVGALLRSSQGHGLSHRVAVPWLLAASSLLLAEHSQSS